MVADNDYGVAQLVEAVSHSPIWESTAIFVIEDNAQNGPDHVDVHRSICYVLSPWIRAGSVDHSFQNTVSVIKTMELLMGLGPMCQYDAASGAIMDWDVRPSNNAPYDAILPGQNIIGEVLSLGAFRCPSRGRLDGVVGTEARGGVGRDGLHSRRPRGPDLLNRIIWKSVKGVEAEPPTTPQRRTCIPLRPDHPPA